MKFFWVILILFLETRALAQPLQPPPDDSRILCVMDTSYSMRLMATGAVSSVRGLITSGFDAFLDPGQQFSVWGFNEEVAHAPLFPRPWNPGEASIEADDAARFIVHQPFQKQTRFDRLIPEIKRFARFKESLVVLIFTDGEDKIYGTPFDSVLNDWIKSAGREARRTKTPVIIMLAASRGSFISWNVQAASAPLRIPEGAKIPTPPPAPEEAAKPPPAAQPAPTTPPALDPNVALAVVQQEIPGVIINPRRPPPPVEVVTNAPEPEPVKPAVTIPEPVAVTPPPAVELAEPPPVAETNNAVKAEPAVPSSQEAESREPHTERRITPKPITAIATPASTGKGHGMLFALGALVLAGIAVAVFAARKQNKPSSSLITQALKK